jgi:hypothetical protein
MAVQIKAVQIVDKYGQLVFPPRVRNKKVKKEELEKYRKYLNRWYSTRLKRDDIKIYFVFRKKKLCKLTPDFTEQ